MKIDTSSGFKVSDEKTTRKQFIKLALELGCLHELLNLFTKYDNYMKQARDDSERLDIGKHGAKEVYFLLAGRAGGGDLVINGELIYSDPDKKEDNESKIIIP
jgi:hypothetical protein